MKKIILAIGIVIVMAGVYIFTFLSSGSENTETVEDENVEKKVEVIDIGGSPFMDYFDGTLNTSGEIKSLVFMVDFQDVVFSEDCYDREELENTLFSDEDVLSYNYPLESVRAYYDRASYGKMDVDGDVYYYKAKYDREYYRNCNQYETLAMEIFDYFDDTVDFSQYDGDGNGYLDCFSINVPKDGTTGDDFWYGCQATWYVNPEYSVDNTKIKGFIMNDGIPSEYGISEYIGILCHEMGHLMALPDYYKYNTPDDWEGLKGVGGFERMDDCYGDFSSYSKLMLGWINELIIYDKEITQYSLSPIEEKGNCIIISDNKIESTKDLLDNYYIIEYVNGTENNHIDCGKNGIRIFKVVGETIESPYNKEKQLLKYENYSDYYDKSDNGKRVLSFLNEGGELMGKNKSLVLENGLEIKVLETSDHKCSIEIK